MSSSYAQGSSLDNSDLPPLILGNQPHLEQTAQESNEMMLIYERLNIAESTLENLKDRLDVPHMARLIDANFYSYFPKMFLLRDEVSSLTRHSDDDRGKIADLESQSKDFT